MPVSEKVIIIGENINIMSKTIGPAIRSRDPKPIQKMAEELTENGCDYLDLNLGPARKAGDEMMEWLVKTVQEVTDLPVWLDTTNADAVRAGLKAYKYKKDIRPVINSISAQKESLETKMPMVKEFDCEFVALTLSEEGIPRDENERGVCASTIYSKALELGISEDRMWIDPIVLPISVDPNQVKAFMNFLPLIPEFAPGAKSTCGLSNISNGTPTHLRPILNRAYMAMLMNLGITSAIVDGYDKEMIKLCKGERPDIVEFVGRVMNGEEFDEKSLDEEKFQYYRSVKVLKGDILYSHSWLEV